MSDLKLTINETRTNFVPGDRITGELRWNGAERPARIGVQLAWRTEGKGDTDTGYTARSETDSPAPGDGAPFELVVPAGPFTYHGRLISLNWRIEAYAEKPEELETRPIVISPTGYPMMFEKTA